MTSNGWKQSVIGEQNKTGHANMRTPLPCVNTYAYHYNNTKFTKRRNAVTRLQRHWQNR